MFGTRHIAAATPQVTAESILKNPDWPDSFPFPDDAFTRFDESPDAVFYDSPRFVTHIDDNAISSLTKHYSDVFPPSGNKDVAILDLCSSWISHYPEGYTAGRIVGLGMNDSELKRNKVLTETVVQDLNKDPQMPYFSDNSFDVITNAVSVDYLTQPLEVFQEMHRILKPGGLAIMSFSNRCFPTKAISLWTGTDDIYHCLIVGSYFHYSVKNGWTAPQSREITLSKGRGDPMFVVFARKNTQ